MKLDPEDYIVFNNIGQAYKSAIPWSKMLIY